MDPENIAWLRSLSDECGDWWTGAGHELMFKERIPPSYFEAILVQDEFWKNALLEHLRSQGLIQKDSFGEETILGFPVEKFLLYWTKNKFIACNSLVLSIQSTKIAA